MPLHGSDEFGYDIISAARLPYRGNDGMFTLNDILQGNQDSIHLQSSAPIHSEQIFPEAQHDSRMVGPGDLFVAIRGAHTDGHRFIVNAARAGAGAVLCMEPSPDVPPDFLQI